MNRRILATAVLSLLFLAPAALFFAPAAQAKLFKEPRVVIKGVPHKLVARDIKTGQMHDYGDGYCRRQAFKRSSGAGASTGMTGPYAILDDAGKIVRVFPSQGNKRRFKVLFRVWCTSK